jgi:steroid delta-isomerase-like uncharacterized protein
MSTTTPVWDFSCVEDWTGFRHVLDRVVTLTEERNRLVVLRSYDATNRGDMSALEDLVSEDYVEHDPMPGQPQGLEGMRWAHARLVAAFSDFRFTIEDILAEDDLVFVRGFMDGTHDGPLGALEPTGKHVRVTGSRMFRVHQGRVCEGWADIDTIGLFQQLGVIPAPPAPPAPGGAREPATPAQATTVPTRAEAKAVMRRMVEELWNKGDLSVADELFHPASVSPSAPQLPPGPEGVRAIVSSFRAAFPDYWIRIEEIVASGDRVAARFRQGGTHKGDLMGIPATGKRVEWSEMGVLRLTDGQVAESWYDVDLLALMTQLGVVPTPKPTPQNRPSRGDSMATSDEMKRIFLRFAHEAWDNGNTDVVFETFAPEYHAHATDPAHDIHGPDGHAEFITGFREAFPDVHVDVHHVVVEDDLIVAHMSWSGTHLASYQGMPATGRSIAVQVIGINRFVGDKIVEAWGVVDMLGMLQQLGMIPAASGAPAGG